MTLKKIVDGVEVNCSPEEITEFEALQAAAPTSSQIALDCLRKERDSLLLKTDWWASSDLTMTQAQIDYRQALRDLPANSPNVAFDEEGYLTGVTWPTEPS